MHKMVVCREGCGCITQIVVDIQYLTLGDVLDSLRRGDTIKLEEHERLGFEQCDKHKAMAEAA